MKHKYIQPHRHGRCAVSEVIESMKKPSAHIIGVSFTLVIFFNTLLPFIDIARAQTQEGTSGATNAPAQTPSTTVPSGVVETTFDITAYYSPLADQERYVTGSYAGDIRLNGGGVRGADGTAVYPGMVAAPSKYAFGTKMHIPGIGTVAVHDRGGAIVTAGNNLKYDRLDIWMGRGDEGLRRALTWGRRIVRVTVYGIDPTINEQVSFANLVDAEYAGQAVVVRKPVKPPMFEKDIWNLSHGKEVVKLQKTLQSLGYFEHQKITGFYGEETRLAVLEFQKDNGLFTSEDTLGAGHTGPQTRITLEKAFTERRRSKMPAQQLGRGSQGEDVSKLQEILKSLGYDVKLTGVFDDQTEEALFTFQKDQKIVTSEKDRGAGYFGARTMDALEKAYINSVTNDASVAVVEVPSYLVQDLSLDSSGDAVRQLQAELKRLNYLRIEPTGLYGPVTAHAVFKFQQSQGLVQTLNDQGAQVFGPATRARLNQIIAQRFHVERLIASTRPISNQLVAGAKPVTIVTVTIAEGLARGGDAVQTRALQSFLQNKGYLRSEDITGIFGDRTEQALIAFQKAHRLIVSSSDTGAGRVGPKTKALIEAFNRVKSA